MQEEEDYLIDLMREEEQAERRRREAEAAAAKREAARRDMIAANAEMLRLKVCVCRWGRVWVGALCSLELCVCVPVCWWGAVSGVIAADARSVDMLS